MREIVMANSGSETTKGLLRKCGIAGLLASATILGACAQTGGGEMNGAAALLASHQPPEETPHQDELGRALSYWGKEYQKNPRDKTIALSYAKNLKAAGHNAQALAVLQYASTFHGHDKEIASEYGRLALSAGQIQVAQKLLAIADDPSNPDWRIVMARGTVLAKQNQYKAAIPFFERALALAPSNATALSNLAMAHAGNGELRTAETLLRKAMIMPETNPTVRRNLTVVLDLMGRKDEAQRVASGSEVVPIRPTVGQPAEASPFNRNGRTVADARR
jgi:Flp pilus assembly protein TadD